MARLKAAAGRKPRLLDLCCGAGGASVGYALAGFDVTGIDIKYQGNYPFRFVMQDALDADLEGFDAVHASPPCQFYSATRNVNRHKTDDDYQDLIPAFRAKLKAWGGPWIIENVEGSSLKPEASIVLCGSNFNLKTYRHRVFESNVFLMAQPHSPHRHKIARRSKDIEGNPDAYLNPVGHYPCVKRHAQAVGIDWRMTREELAQAIPPAYTRYLGAQLLNFLANRRDR